MKIFRIAGLACLMMFGFSGCSEGESATSTTLNMDLPATDSDADVHTVSKPVIDELKQDSGEVVAKLKRKTEEAIDAAADATQKKKDLYTAELKDKLQNLKGDIDALKESAKNIKDEAKDEFATKTDDLSQKREAFEEKLEELENSSVDMWSSLKDGLTSAWAEFQKSFEVASRHVDDENAAVENSNSADKSKDESAEEAADSK